MCVVIRAYALGSGECFFFSAFYDGADPIFFLALSGNERRSDSMKNGHFSHSFVRIPECSEN